MRRTSSNTLNNTIILSEVVIILIISPPQGGVVVRGGGGGAFNNQNCDFHQLSLNGPPEAISGAKTLTNAHSWQITNENLYFRHPL